MNEIKRKATGMKSLAELYKIGRGPSSSHTMGPERACKEFLKHYSDVDDICVFLYGSLAKTGKGHGTDRVIEKTLAPISCKVIFDFDKTDIPHPNTLELVGFKEGAEAVRVKVMSVGGGSILYDGEEQIDTPDVYDLHKFSDIAEYCKKKYIRLWEYAIEKEGPDFFDYMYKVWEQMKDTIHRGLDDEGILPGGLSVKKKAKSLYHSQHIDESPETREHRMVCSFAFAVGEQNASGERVVTAPTCGAAGVLPAVLYYQQQKHRFSDRQIVEALITAGIIGNLIKTNASISGAECGCQAEIGSACSMAAAAVAQLYGLSIDQIEYAAEIAMEHNLGLTCDPVGGLVQIPCIERNAVAAMRALSAVNLSRFLYETRKISFDEVVATMYRTGIDLNEKYRETSHGGLAQIYMENLQA